METEAIVRRAQNRKIIDHVEIISYLLCVLELKLALKAIEMRP